MKTLRSSFAIVLLLAGIFQLAATAAESPWQRVVVVGASASGGFVLSEPFGGTNTTQCKLHYYLDAAITAPHEPVKNLGTAMLFLSPDAIATQQVEAATNNQPTLVIGVDFLFWFCYGAGRTDADRAQHFEKGLNLLERIPCPLVVGDIPDVSVATNSGIISPAQVPSETARLAANERLRAWAATRPQVTIMPLAENLRTMAMKTAITIQGQKVAIGKIEAVMQPDQLHPTPRGAALLGLQILDTLVTHQPKFPTAAIRWNWEEVFRLGYQAATAKPKPVPANK